MINIFIGNFQQKALYNKIKWFIVKIQLDLHKNIKKYAPKHCENLNRFFLSEPKKSIAKAEGRGLVTIENCFELGKL